RSDRDWSSDVCSSDLGTYRVEVDAPGFKHSTRTGLQLSADARLTADVRLEIGEATQSVDVVATQTETVNTVSGEVSHVIDKEQEIGRASCREREWIEE